MINFSNTAVNKIFDDYLLNRAKSFKVKTSSHDFAQYVRTVKAYALARMTFGDIANAGDILGDEVERKETDAPVSTGQEKVGEIAEEEDQILAWQKRGERVSITHQLTSSQTTGKEVVIISNSITTIEQAKENTIEVVEGINIVKQNLQSLPSPTSSSNTDAELENNPYLKAPPQEIRKVG